MIEPDVTMNREEISAFMGKLKNLRDGLDDFNCHLAALDGAGMRLGLLCQETAAACPAAVAPMAQSLSGLAQALRSFGGTTGDVGGGATPAQALYMVGLILPPKTAAA